MFPFDTMDTDSTTTATSTTTIPTEYGINFETGQLTGEIVTGLDAIKVWAYLALRADRYYYEQYSWGYGHEIASLIGQSYSKELIETELKRMITEALSTNTHISGIKDFSCVVDGDSVSATFTIISDYGEVATSV